MKVVTFYSFKGGVGRSLTLANVAYQLCKAHGLRVGLLDLDVEAGGLHHIFGVGAREDLDLLSLLDPSNRDLSKLEEHVLEVAIGRQRALYLIPTLSDSKHLDKIRWDLATHHFLTDQLIPEFAKLYELDLVFLDSRSGFSEFSVSALKAGSIEVLVCRLDSQNRFGIQRIVQVCNAASKPYRLVVSACPPTGHRKHLANFAKDVASPIHHVLPYDQRLYFGEVIVSDSSPVGKLARGYRKLADDIARATDEAAQS